MATQLVVRRKPLERCAEPTASHHTAEITLGVIVVY
ncbi:hypothetical protein [Achromobacter phage CF418P1]|nr:hypothetical protein [Achromobacter phage CF418P1]